MTDLPPSADKYKLTGIGAASAATLLAVLSTNPATSFLTAGILGKITFWIIENIFTKLASMGLVLLNVGAERFLTVAEKVNFDGSLDSAEKMIEEIQKTGRDLTPKEVKAIDDKVILTFRKFARIGSTKQ